MNKWKIEIDANIYDVSPIYTYLKGKEDTRYCWTFNKSEPKDRYYAFICQYHKKKFWFITTLKMFSTIRGAEAQVLKWYHKPRD